MRHSKRTSFDHFLTDLAWPGTACIQGPRRPTARSRLLAVPGLVNGHLCAAGQRAPPRELASWMADIGPAPLRPRIIMMLSSRGTGAFVAQQPPDQRSTCGADGLPNLTAPSHPSPVESRQAPLTRRAMPASTNAVRASRSRMGSASRDLTRNHRGGNDSRMRPSRRSMSRMALSRP
jgi:hypothetical protein